MSDDPWKDPKFQEFAQSVRTDLVPKLESSGAVVALAPAGEFDVKFAVELGASIMLDKPICLVVRPGTELSDHLVRVADRIVEADLSTESGTELGQQRIREAMTDLLGE